MKLKMADSIRMDWGKFLEITNGNLMMIFHSKIPESLLPYPKNTIKEALDIVTEHFHNQGNTAAVKVVKATIPFLELYVSDKEALRNAAVQFSDAKYLKAIFPHLGEKQKKQLEYVINKVG